MCLNALGQSQLKISFLQHCWCNSFFNPNYVFVLGNKII